MGINTELIANINGVALHGADRLPDEEEIRQRAYSELLRQEAVAQGLLPDDDQPFADGVLSEAASSAIEMLLERELVVPVPDTAAGRRHYQANMARYQVNERVCLRHILFAVVRGVDVTALRQRAEAVLLDVRCHDGKNATDKFAGAAKQFSNCPSGAKGGGLGWLLPQDCAPEFAKELFGHTEVGVLPRLVHSRFGLHVVEVLAREPGNLQTYEEVRGAVAMTLRQTAYVTALRQYLLVLAGAADIQGVTLDSADSPLVQ